MEAVTDFLSWAPKITTDGDCNHEIKRRLLLGRKAMTNQKSESESHSVMSDSLQPHGIPQARILEWVAVPFSKDLPDPGIEPRSPTLQVDSLPSEPPGKQYV